MITGFLSIIIFFIVAYAITIPLINHIRVKELTKQITNLSQIITILTTILKKKGIKIPDITNLKEQSVKQAEEQDTAEEKSYTYEKPTLTKTLKINFEQQFGAKLPVWIGGIALALAGFFLVKYSIEHNLINPIIRLILGVIFSTILLGASYLIRNKPNIANRIPISQSLAGAGISILYLVSYASTRIYGIVPSLVGFIGMTFTTIIAFILSIRHGTPIALLGMVGGFLTPALLGTENKNPFLLFTYLYFVTSGFLILIRKTNLWWLSIPTILFAFGWTIMWLTSSFSLQDGFGLGLFLFALCITIFFTSKDSYKTEQSNKINYLGLGGALILMGIITTKSNFGLMEWSLFALLSIFGIGLAYFNQIQYGFLPWFSMLTNAGMLLAWNTYNPIIFTITLICFASIHIISSYVFMWRDKQPKLWAKLICSVSLIYYLLAYYIVRELYSIPFLWGAIAAILAIAAICTMRLITKFCANNKEYLLAIFAVAATSFISIALTIEVEYKFLSSAIAIEIAAISLINSKVSIKSLRQITAILAIAVIILLCSQILNIIGIITSSVFTPQYSHIPDINWNHLQLGIPATMFLISTYFLEKEKRDLISNSFEYIAIILFALTSYYAVGNVLYFGQYQLILKESLFERGIITNLIYLYGLLCLWSGKKFKRTALTNSGIIIFSIAMLRIIYFDMIAYNWLWKTLKIEGTILLNTLLLPFGLPLIWYYIAAKQKFISINKKQAIFALAALFMLVTSNVRYMFHGTYLDYGITTNAETYTYSAAWLLLGMGLLFAGIITQHKVLRYASLYIILFTTFKVFVYDASALEGLYRIFSFLGLGVSLIGLSYFYAKFIFTSTKSEK